MPHLRTGATMFEAGVVATVTAWHVMPGMQGPEGQLHSHDYRIEVTARRTRLDERGMVVDIDLLGDALRSVLAEIENRNLDQVVPHEDGRGVTVEALARWAHERVGARIGNEAVGLGVRVWESADAFGGYETPASTSS